MNIAVVGGSGFIGSHVVDKLIDHGHDVTVFDIRRPHRPDVPQVHIDITDLFKTTIALTGYYDAVYHLAAVANVGDVHRNPVESLEVNIMGVANILEAARRNQIRRVILASTTWVYALSPQKEVNREDDPFLMDTGEHVYIASKMAGELLCHSYQKLYGQDFTILRYGIPYGPRARGGTILAEFVRRAFHGEPLIIFGDGHQYRTFIYAEDLAEGNVCALQEVARNQTYNLEGPRPVTATEVAETVRKLTGEVKIEYREARPGDFRGRMVSSEKAARELGWRPQVTFEEGARRYVEWYKATLPPRQK